MLKKITFILPNSLFGRTAVKWMAPILCLGITACGKGLLVKSGPQNINDHVQSSDGGVALSSDADHLSPPQDANPLVDLPPLQNNNDSTPDIPPIEQPPDKPGWTLVWNDEFDKPGMLDPTRWNYETGYIRNNELQYYTKARAENARVENGFLTIEARKDNFQNHAITSASVITKGKKTFLYGRIEVRAKLPTGKGTWPAIWLLGTAIDQLGWPACGEIDIMENVGFEPEKIYGTVHTKDYNHVNNTAKGGNTTAKEPWNQFYTYAIEWSPEKIDFFVDDKQYFTFQNEGTGQGAWPFDKEHYLLINLAIGGEWGGMQGVDENLLPQTYLIDYVRVYQKN